MNILSETTYHYLTPLGRSFCIVGLVCLIVMLVGLFNDINSLMLTSGIIGAILILASFIFFTEPYQQIKATISDDYPAVKLYEEYDVVRHDGKIWILNEKF